MSLPKHERHLQDLKQYPLRDKALKHYLLENSNLPGKRGNLELAFSFGDYIEEICGNDSSDCFRFCLDLISENPIERNTARNEEFLPFCAVVALGRIGKHHQNKRKNILGILKENAKDGRWRIREAVAVALQDLLVAAPDETISELKKWVREDHYLVHRAGAAGFAEPRLMKNVEIAKAALTVHKEIISRVEAEKDTKSEHFKVLVKGLCYTLSVVVTGNEAEGFRYLEELVKRKNPVIRKIVKENLKKNRLRRLNGNKVSELLNRLNDSEYPSVMNLKKGSLK